MEKNENKIRKVSSMFSTNENNKTSLSGTVEVS
jgi:hypothetical protein